MRFTICIPTYNRADKISNSLDSLVKQKFKDFEVIVIDDGSQAKAEKVVNKYKDKLKLTYIYQDNGGKHTAINKGLDNAKGELFLILDDKLVLYEDALSIFDKKWSEIEDNEKIMGMMALSDTYKNKNKAKPCDGSQFSYCDFHFKMDLNDCVEANRTKYLKEVRWPTSEKTKFMLEAYVFDRLGLKYDLIFIDKIVRHDEYIEGGITRNIIEFRRKNAYGFLLDCQDKIDNIFKNYKVNMEIKLKYWIKYYSLSKYIKKKDVPRIKTKSVLRIMGKILSVFFKF